MSPETRLSYAAAEISRRVPDELWKEFLGAIAAYADTARDHCVNSPLELLQQAQGRAQATVAVSRLLHECRATADRIEAHERARPKQPTTAV